MFLTSLLVATLLTQAPASPATRAAETLALGPVLDAVERDGVAYVALERGGIAVISLQPAPPRLLRRLEEGRRFVRLVLAGESLLAVEQREEAHAFSLSAPESPQPSSLARALSGTRELAVVGSRPQDPPSSPSAPPLPERPREDAARLTITQVRGGGDVVLSGGRNAGLSRGMHVRLLGTGAEQEVILEVVEVRETEAIAQLGRGESAPVGAAVELTDAPVTSRLFFPQVGTPRLRYGFLARPFLALGARTRTGQSARAGGMLVDAMIAWHPEQWPLVVSAKLEPIGFGLGTGERHTPGTAYLSVAYSTDFLEVGAGAGALFGQPDCFLPFDPNTGQSLPGPEQCDSESGGAVQQTLRLGSLDGFHLAWSSTILSRNNQFVFGSGRGELQVPLTTRLSLFGAGGGARTGWAFGELGVRTFLQGTGGAGSTMLTSSLGIVSVFDGRGGDSLTGPSVSIGMEWRP